jgi:plasmid maintenance system antidote protein VapI
MSIQQEPEHTGEVTWCPVCRENCRKWVDPAIWERSDMREALAVRNISRVYRLLQRYGVSQRRIAERVGMNQSEVSEILGGRRVLSYDVLVRVAEGLGVPRGWMGLELNIGGQQ